MKVFYQFVKKEFIHILRDQRTLALLIGMPVLLVTAFGFALTTDIKDVSVSIASPQNSPFVERLIQRLDASENMRFDQLLMPSNHTDQLLLEGTSQVVIVLPNHFETDLHQGLQPAIQLRIDGMDSNSAARISGFVQGIFYDCIKEELEGVMRNADPALLQEQPYRIEILGVPLFNPEMKASYYFVPGVMGLVLMIVCAMMTSVSIVREKEYGSMELLLTSPIHPSTIIIAKAVPYFCISVINIISILLIARFVLHVPIRGSLWLIGLASFFFILVSLLLGLLISTLTDNQTVSMLISGAGLLLPVSMLSGMFFPIESMPTALIHTSYIIPARWYVSALSKLLIQGVSWQGVWMDITILAGMTLLLTFAGIKSFKLKI